MKKAQEALQYVQVKTRKTKIGQNEIKNMGFKLKVATSSSTQNLRKQKNYSETSIWGSVALREIFCLYI